MDDTTSLEDDLLDGCDVCMHQVDLNIDTCPDDHIDALVIFADVDFTDEVAVADRKAEMEMLDAT